MSRSTAGSCARPTLRAAPGSRSAFTMIELVLATVLGVLVIIGAFALFETMDRAKRLQANRLERNVELGIAHKTMQQAFRTLLMDGATTPKDDELDKGVKDDMDDSFAHADQRREDAADMRFALQPDAGKHSKAGYLQSLDMTLTTPPIHAATLSQTADAEESAQLRRLALERRSGSDVYKPVANSDSGFGSSSRSSSSDSSSDEAQARADRLRNASAGLTGNAASPESALAAASHGIEAPRAPGVRGTFEFRPEDDPRVLAKAAGSGNAGQLWALWWKQIPYDDSIDPPSNGSTEDRAKRLQLLDMARASRTDVPQIKLLSGLTDASWQAYRRRQMVPKMAAKFAQELPAYVEFKFETIEGRHEDWLFEIAWSYGQEPGSEMAVNDPLAAPTLAGAGGNDPNSVAAAVQAALNAARGGSPGGSGTSTAVKTPGSPITSKPGTGTSTGTIAASGGSGSGTSAGTGSSPSLNNPNATTNPDGSITIHLPGGGTITIPANAVNGRK